MQLLRDFHHYKPNLISDSDRISRLEYEIVQSLISSDVPDSDRESSVVFELKHSSNVTQFARLIARKRGLDVEACAAGALLHDIYVIMTGKYKDHASLGVPIAEELLAAGGFKDSYQNSDIIRLIKCHSDKHLYSADRFEEFGKDIDVLDCFLYPGAVEFYICNKPVSHMFHYLARTKRIWTDLGIPIPASLRILDDYRAPWLSHTCYASADALTSFLSNFQFRDDVDTSSRGPTSQLLSPDQSCVPPSFLIRVTNHGVTVNFSEFGRSNLERFGYLEHGKTKLMSSIVCSSPEPGCRDQFLEHTQHLNPKMNECFDLMVWTGLNLIQPFDPAIDNSRKISELIE